MLNSRGSGLHQQPLGNIFYIRYNSLKKTVRCTQFLWCICVLLDGRSAQSQQRLAQIRYGSQ